MQEYSIEKLDPHGLKKIINSEHHDPFSVLGMHRISGNCGTGMAIRGYFPGIQTANIITLEGAFPMDRITDCGFFEAIFMEKPEFFKYEIELKDNSGGIRMIKDPYSFLPVLGEFDCHLFGEGTHYRIYEKLGAHFIKHQDTPGVHFAVWAPCARRISAVGDFNQWDGHWHVMRNLGSSGIWEIFIPDLNPGEIYKFEIKSLNGNVFYKSDPYAFFSELPPKTGSIVWDITSYKWGDKEWIEQRKEANPYKLPMNIYELHLGSWGKSGSGSQDFLSYEDLASSLIPYIKEMGFTHIELLPVTEHPFGGSWGYQTTQYFAPTSRMGQPDGFMRFVDLCHQNKIGVIMDWVPAHFPRDDFSLARFDGTCLYEHADPREGEHPDWGTLIFNFGRKEVHNFLIASALFWLEKYHLDGLRLDAVASMLYRDYSRKEGEWIPNQYGGRENLEAIDFIRHLNNIIYERFPGAITIAEESTAWPGVSHPVYLGGLGFGFKWNMGWMNDILSYFTKDPIFRKYHHDKLTFALLYAFNENFILVLSHDEVVYGKRSLLNKMPGDIPQKFANLRLLLGYMYVQPGKKLLFMGGEFGQWDEWTHDKSLDWHLLEYPLHKKMQVYTRELNRLCRNETPLHQVDFNYTGFRWIDFSDVESCIVSFMRIAENPDDYLIFVYNFTPVCRENYFIGVPEDLFYKEIFNSESEIFGGCNIGNGGGLHSERAPNHGMEYSLRLKIPPLAMVVFKPAR
ncbi:MAG: 1,4-alpha-glucan branching protein GlgB [bacterium]